VEVGKINYPLDKQYYPKVATWTYKLLDRAYGESQKQKRNKVLINPFGGKGSAQKYYARDIAPILSAARCTIDVERTQYRGHAVEIAEHLDIDAYDVVASCSGDGLPHEVFNGLGNRRDARTALAKVAVVQFPCGSGNAMSLNLNDTDSPSLAALCVIKGLRTPLDLISVTQGDKRILSFLSQSLGIVAETDLGTDNLRWMGGHRFTFGLAVRILGKTVYPCDIAVKVEIEDKKDIKAHYRRELENRTPAESRRGDISSDAGLLPKHEGDGLPVLKYGAVSDPLPAGWNLVPHHQLGNFYAGNMTLMAAATPFFPATLPNDGCLDLVCIDGDCSRFVAVKVLTSVENGKLFEMEQVSYRKVLGYRVIPKSKGDGAGWISIDGESVPFQPFQAEVHRGLGTVLSRSGHTYEPDGLLSMGS
jgi:sphingosine kinase